MKCFFHLSIPALVITLSACGSMSSVGALPNNMPVAIPQAGADNNRLPSGAEVQRANDLLNRGQRRDAAKMYFNTAQQYNSPDRERLILQAAELATLISDSALTQIYLSALGNQLNKQNMARYRYVQGQLAIMDRENNEALRLLPRQVNGLPSGLQQKILAARMRAAQAGGDYLVLATEIVLQEHRLKLPHQLKLNHDRICNQVSRLSEKTLEDARLRVPHPIMRGWLDLNYLKRISSTDSAQLNRNIKSWQRNFPRHPANARASKMMRKISVSPYQPNIVAPVKPVIKPSPNPVVTSPAVTNPINKKRPIIGGATPPLPTSIRHVAAILPLTGSLSAVGQSLLNGIKKAQKDHTSGVQLKIYDSNSDNINAVYGKAISSGQVDFVIGPFSKEKIAQLSRSGSLPVNTLSLNYIGRLKAATGLYQFGLLPEDEAVQVAQRMLSRGHKKIAIVVPDSGWGRRLRNSFGNAFKRGGGKAVITINYTSSKSSYHDISKAISKRKKSLDAVFLAASPSQARGIQALLHKGKLKSLPVYATSHIYSGLANQYQNVDLEGITYSEIPWILEVAHKGLPQDSQFPRLRALGMDALMVAKGLPRLRNGAALNGRTGQIKLHNDGTLHRQLKWAKFNGGSPIPLPN
jgi:outer membrane PBP1 activator LpoA protein